MAKETPSPKPVRIKRLQIGLNVFAQLLIVFLVLCMVNLISFRQYTRWDFSRNKKYALSSMTVNLVKSLPKPVKAIVFFNANTPVAGDVSQLLREYEYASKKRFRVEMVDPYNNVLRAKELASQYKFGSSDNIVILDYNGRTKFVNAMDMVEFEPLDQIAQMSGQQPRLKSFKGEQAITSALLEITEEKQNRVYLLSGHGEPDLNGASLSGFKNYCERQNIKLQSLKLNDVDRIPEDASALMIFGARADFSEREMGLVRGFWAKKGRLFVLLDPDGRTPRLDTFLLQNGTAPTHDRVLRMDKTLARDDKQEIAIRPVVMISPTGVLTQSGKEINKDLSGIDTGLIGPTESLEIDRARAQTDNLRILSLIESSKEFWGETEFAAQKEVPFFDPKKDHQGPLTLAAAVEKGALGVKVDTSRIVVVGNSTWLTDDGLREAQVGIDFAMNSLNWLLNREQLIGIPPKAKQPIHLDLDESKLSQIALTVILLIPCLFGALGFGAWVMRRS